jgi:invasion protein IalB
MPFDLNSNPVRIAIGAALLVLGLLIGWFGHKAASAPPDVASMSIYDDWRLTCPKASEKDLSCGMQLDVTDPKSQSAIARLEIFHAKGTNTNTMIVTVPFNVLLEPGIGIVLNKDKPKIYPYEVCNQVGCVVRVPFDDALANGMLNAKTAILLVAGLDGKAAGLPFSLKGFAAAHQAFVSDMAKRHSAWRRFWS